MGIDGLGVQRHVVRDWTPPGGARTSSARSR
jgi:hypothetical protein